MSAPARAAFADEQIAMFVKAIQAAPGSARQSAGNASKFAQLADLVVGTIPAALEGITPKTGLAVAGVTTVVLSDFAAQDPSVYAVANFDDEWIILRMSARAFDWMVAASLGGSPQNTPDLSRPVSRIESAIARVIAGRIFNGIAETFGGYGFIADRNGISVATAPEDLKRIPADVGMTVISAGLAVAGETAVFDVAVTPAIIASWQASADEENTSSDSPAQGKSPDMPEGEDRLAPLPAIKVGVSAILCEQVIELDDILKWSVGEPILLGVTADASVQLLANDVPLFMAELGRMNGWMCVKVSNEAVEIAPDALTGL